MERAIISWNVPNLITIPLMAFLGFILAATVWQVGTKMMGQGGGSQPSPAGY